MKVWRSFFLFFFIFCMTANKLSVKSNILFVLLIFFFSLSLTLLPLHSFLPCCLLSDASVKNLWASYDDSVAKGLFLFSVLFLLYFSSPRWWGQLFRLFQDRKYSLRIYKVSRKWGIYILEKKKKLLNNTMNQHVSLFVLRRVTVINYARYSKEYMIQNQSLFRIFVVVLFVVIFFSK